MALLKRKKSIENPGAKKKKKPLVSVHEIKTIFSQARVTFIVPACACVRVRVCVCVRVRVCARVSNIMPTFVDTQTEVIYNFNNHFLQTIQGRLDSWHYEQTIGDIFLSVVCPS